MEAQITWIDTLLAINYILPGLLEDFQVAKRIFSIKVLPCSFYK